jgi:multidrug resistance protein MdtO
MWLFFDQFWSAPAAVEMKRKFTSILQLLAQLAREPVSKDMRIAIERSYVLRETITAHFNEARSLGGAVLFEFGPTRERDLALRRQLRRWDPQLRTLFVMRTASWKYRLQLPGFDLPEAERDLQQEFDDRSARMLEQMADRIDGQPQVKNSVGAQEQVLKVSFAAEAQHLPAPHTRSFLTLLRGIDSLTTSLSEEIAKEFDRREQLATIEKIDRETGLEPA